MQDMNVMNNGRRAVFLDRDGVINEVISGPGGRPGSPRRYADFVLVPGLNVAVERLKEMGLVVIVVTNQPDIARGLMEMSELERMFERIRTEFRIDDIIVCTHDDRDECRCRKPRPGMLVNASEKWGITLSESFFVGDTWKDAEAGRAAGCTTVMIDTHYNRTVECDLRVADLSEAARRIGQVLDYGNREKNCNPEVRG